MRKFRGAVRTMEITESEEHIERCKEMLGKSSTPGYLRKVAKDSIHYHKSLIKIEEGCEKDG